MGKQMPGARSALHYPSLRGNIYGEALTSPVNPIRETIDSDFG